MLYFKAFSYDRTTQAKSRPAAIKNLQQGVKITSRIPSGPTDPELIYAENWATSLCDDVQRDVCKTAERPVSITGNLPQHLGRFKVHEYTYKANDPPPPGV